MRLRLPLLALLLLPACVKRIAPSAGEDRTVLSGVPAVFGREMEVPAGATVTWSFGDGTPVQTGPQVTHAFPRAGAFEVAQTIRDRDGQERASKAQVTVLRRAVAMAIPADARAALILEYPWSKIPLHRSVASRLGLRETFEDLARSVSDALGFDALDGQKAADNGFDPDEGVACFTVPQDEEAVVAVVGTSDDAKALAAVRRMLTHEAGAGKLAGGPYQLSDAKLPDGTPALVGAGTGGEKIAVVQRYGYLYLRTAGSTQDPLLALRGVLALSPDRGLSADPSFLAALKHVGAGDLVFYSHPAQKPGSPDSARSRFTEQFGSSAFALIDHDDQVEMHLFAQLKNLSGEALQRLFKPAKDAPDLAAKLPAGPAAYLKLSVAPVAQWAELSKDSPADAARLKERVQELTSLDLEKDLLPAFTGNVGIAVYLDAASLMDAVLGEQVASLDKSTALLVAELSEGKAAGLEAALARVSKGAALHVPGGGTAYRLGEVARAATKGGYFFLALGGPAAEAETAPPKVEPPRKKGAKVKAPARPPEPAPATALELGALAPLLLADPKLATLSQSLQEASLRGFDVPEQQLFFADIQGLVHAVELAAQERGGVVGAGARLFAERAAGLRDALFELRPGADGLDARLFVRFAGKGAATGGK